MLIEAHTIATHSPPRDWLYALVIVKLSSSLPVAALLIGALSLLTGCQPGAYVSSDFVAPVAGDRVPLADIDWLADPHDWVGPSTALLGVADIEPAAINPPQTLPLTVESDELGEPLRVTITSTDRLLALDMSGSLAATVWALGLGDQLVGRDISTTFPGSEALPVVTGSGHAIAPESVLALRPDLIITDGTIGPLDVVLQLREAGVTVVFVRKPPGLDAPAEMALAVGKILGVADVGSQLASRISNDIETVSAVIAQNTPSKTEDKLRMVFVYLRGGNGIYYLFGEESGSSDLIESLGGRDIATEIGWTGLRPMTDEALISANPDLILVMTHGLQSVGGVDKLLEAKPALGLTTAGANRRFVDMADSQVLSFGPRTPEVMDALARAIYSPATK